MELSADAKNNNNHDHDHDHNHNHNNNNNNNNLNNNLNDNLNNNVQKLGNYKMRRVKSVSPLPPLHTNVLNKSGSNLYLK